MALARTVGAIGAVTGAIKARLQERTPLNVTVGRPEPNGGGTGPRLNLFLYEVQFDGSLKNVPLDEGQRPPLWLILKYLMTAFEDDKTSDSIKAQENLGAGISALQDLSFLPFASSDSLDALRDNPEDLKITFDDASTDLLAKVMQGSDEKYRLSVAFQVRPVMIASGELPSYSLLVGVDYTTAPPTSIGEAGIRIPVLPSLGPSITEVSPAGFELGATVTIKGTDLHLAGLSVNLGPVELPVTMQRQDQLQFVVREDIATPAVISAGSLPISVAQMLPTGRRRFSNLLIGNLRPTIAGVAISGTVNSVASTPPPLGWTFATIDVTGKLLGQDGDDEFYLVLFKDGKTVKVFDALVDMSGGAQTARRFVMQKADAVPPGEYLALYRVNGQQAPQAALIGLTP